MKTCSYNHFLFFCFILGAFLLGLLSPAYALSVITTKEIDANLPNGAIESRVVLGKRVFKVEAHGFYFRNNATNSIDIEITSLLRDNQSFPLTSPAKTSLKIPPNAKIKKSTILVLKGENAEEVAKILGISKEEYQKLENTAQTNATNDPMYANTPFSNGSDSSVYDNNPNSPNNNAINGKDGVNGSSGYGINGNDGINGSSGSNGNNSNNNAVGSGIDTDGVLGVDGVNGSNSSSGGSVGGYENNFTNHGSTNNNTGGHDNFDNNSSSGGGLGNGGFFPIPFGNGGTNNSNNPTNTTSPTNGSSSNNATNPNSQENNYSSQYCKAPKLSPNNTMKLDVIAKDGSCISMNALRDDTKCTYRYDFEAGKAIKQTQYYYVDRENKTQNIGGCVDLQGAQYAMQLYKDDSKCALQTTSDKGYGMGKTQTFQTEIVFRGMDNLIHVAVPCSDNQTILKRIEKAKQKEKDLANYGACVAIGERRRLGDVSTNAIKNYEVLCNACADNVLLEAFKKTFIQAIIDAKSEIDNGNAYHTQKFKFPFYGCVDRLVAISLAKSYTYDFTTNEIKEVVVIDKINCNLISKANKFTQGVSNEN
ncbi:competence protein [Helicobacter pylori]|uniref:competence protein n=1 Tax=Helicobacter pylori TaxID=210 RepID=UPI001F267367|nr:competence protein [Helicobacter pylori]